MKKSFSALPGTLTADTLYAVRVGDGFDLHISDSTGSVAHKVNQNKTLITTGNRWSCETDLRWVTNSDDYYGHGAHNANEACGTGTDPEIEWEHLGIYLPAGAEIKNFHIIGNVNFNEVTDIEIALYKRQPPLTSAWNTGIDADGEMTNTELWKDSFYTPTGLTAFTGATTATHVRTIALDETFTDPGFFQYVHEAKWNTNNSQIFSLCHYARSHPLALKTNSNGARLKPGFFMLNIKRIEVNEHTGEYMLMEEDQHVVFLEGVYDFDIQIVITKDIIATSPINILQSGKGKIRIINGGKGISIKGDVCSAGRHKALSLYQTRDFISKKQNAKWIVAGGVNG